MDGLSWAGAEHLGVGREPLEGGAHDGGQRVVRQHGQQRGHVRRAAQVPQQGLVAACVCERVQRSIESSRERADPRRESVLPRRFPAQRPVEITHHAHPAPRVGGIHHPCCRCAGPDRGLDRQPRIGVLQMGKHRPLCVDGGQGLLRMRDLHKVPTGGRVETEVRVTLTGERLPRALEAPLAAQHGRNLRDVCRGGRLRQGACVRGRRHRHQVHGVWRGYTWRPPTQVPTTFTSRKAVGSSVNGSRSKRRKSASLPTSRVPFSWSWNSA